VSREEEREGACKNKPYQTMYEISLNVFIMVTFLLSV